MTTAHLVAIPLAAILILGYLVHRWTTRRDQHTAPGGWADDLEACGCDWCQWAVAVEAQQRAAAAEAARLAPDLIAEAETLLRGAQ